MAHVGFGDHPRCTARRRNGLPCRDTAMSGKTTCRRHGGKSLSGTANGFYKHGKYSKVLPPRLQERAAALWGDTSYLSLREDIGVCFARLAELFARVDSGESGNVWERLGHVLEAFRQARDRQDVPTMNTHFTALERLIGTGTSEASAWADIHKTWDVACRLIQTEQKTLITMQQMVTTEQLLVYMDHIKNAIIRRVEAAADPKVARRILSDLSEDFHHLANLDDKDVIEVRKS